MTPFYIHWSYIGGSGEGKLVSVAQFIEHQAETVNIDTLVSNFNSGDRVTLKILKEKGLVSAKANQVKILARTDMTLNKALHIETQGISAQARQKIIAAGGTVTITEG